MMIVELTFTPTPAGERLAARADHRQRLVRLHAEGRLLAAGPWADDTGALLVFDVATRPELERVMAEDPYYRTPGVEVVRVWDWRPVVGLGEG